MANPGPVHYVWMQPGQDAVYLNPVNHGAAAFPPYTQSPAPMQMSAPHQPAGCPPGLEYLTQVGEILIHQKPERHRNGMSNIYYIKNSMGQQVFVATAEEDLSTRLKYGGFQPFTIHVHNNRAQEVLTMIRPLRRSCCYPSPPQELEVLSPSGNLLGNVEVKMSCTHKTTILDDTGTPVLKIKAPGCETLCTVDIIFKVMSLKRSAVVGKIIKEHRGYRQAMSTFANNYRIKFPVDLDVKVKAVLIGACFLFDAMYYQFA
ncbi:uncharacterized protein V6R79_016034 [Siganus canaliculatus]